MNESEPFERIANGLDFPMIVVTTVSRDGERAGCLVGFHSQSSIKPPQYAVWISKANHTYRVALQSESLALHFVGEADRDIAELFGGATGDDVDKFQQCAWSRGHDGIPLLDRVPNRVVGRIVHRFDDEGDHACFIVALTAEGSAFQPLRPLTFQQVKGLPAGHPI